MNTISQVLNTRNYEKEYQELVSKTIGAYSEVKTEPTTAKVTPELNRIPRKEIEASYIKEPTTFNLVNVTTQLIMSSERKLDGDKEDVKFMQTFLDNLGYVGGTMLWEPILTLIIKHQVMFGNAYIEFITSTEKVNGIKPIIDLDIIDPKLMDYAKDSNGNIVQDKRGPVGYVQTLPDNVGGINIDEYKKYKAPKDVALTSYQIYIPRERIVHFKLYQTGDTFYPLGFIEPCYNYVMYKLKLETAMMTAILRHGFPTMLGKMGDVNHMPTPNQIQDLLNSMKDMSYKHEIAVPYYVDIKYLESKTVTQLREHLEYFTEQIITSFGIPQAIATSTGDATNRATLTTSIKVLETTLMMLVTNTVRQIEHNMFMPIAHSHGRGTIPSYEWDNIDTSGLKAELEQKKGQEPKKEQKPSEYK
jgi:hypothetical protein